MSRFKSACKTAKHVQSESKHNHNACIYSGRAHAGESGGKQIWEVMANKKTKP